MSHGTIGRNFYPGMELPIDYNFTEEFNFSEASVHFRLIFIKNGVGIINIEERLIPFVAPCLLCLNESEVIKLEQSREVEAYTIHFQPSFINNGFTYENIRSFFGADDLLETDWQDAYWLKPFIQREQNFYGLLEIGQGTADHVDQLFQKIRRELELQGDLFWPCRSRSFFIELLFLLERISSATTEDHNLQTRPLNDLNPVLLYLYLNYKEKITISNLSKTFNINRTSMCSAFKETTGLSVIDYLIRLRCRLASLLLRDTSIPVVEVAERVGFNNLTHFGRTFNNYSGVSPSEYRNKYCWVLRS